MKYSLRKINNALADLTADIKSNELELPSPPRSSY